MGRKKPLAGNKIRRLGRGTETGGDVGYSEVWGLPRHCGRAEGEVQGVPTASLWIHSCSSEAVPFHFYLLLQPL